MTETSTQERRFSRSGVKATQISVFFVLLTLLLLVTPAAGPMRYGFPALAFISAFFVYRQSKPFYAGFVVWLWMLAPLVRRIVEYRAGGTASLIIASPFLACGVPILLNASSLAELFSPEGYPILFAAAGMLYGLGIGIALHNHIPVIAIELAFWIAPLFFAFFLILFRREVREIRASIERAFIWGTIAIGVYGLYQYLVLAPWDAFWIENSGLVSIGLPEAQQLRVFSTMNSPQGLAAFLVGGIFIAVLSRSWLKWLAIPLASVSLLLTQSRTSFYGFAAGFILLVFGLPAKQKLQVAIVSVLSVILVLGALEGDRKDVLFARLQTVTAPSEDGSFSIRMAGYAVLLPQMLSNPFGAGLGIDTSSANSPLEVNGEGLGNGDSGIIALLFGLGIPGTLVYVTGIGSALLTGFRRRSNVEADEMLAFKAIILASAVTVFASNVFTGSTGFLTWVALTFYYMNSKQLSAAAVYSPAKARSATSRVLDTAGGTPSLGSNVLS